MIRSGLRRGDSYARPTMFYVREETSCRESAYVGNLRVFADFDGVLLDLRKESTAS